MRKQLPAFLLPRIRHILFLAVLSGALMLGPRMLSIDSDLGRHLTLGQFILDQREIPTIDILSLTKNGEPRPPYEWIAQLLFALSFRLAGMDGVLALTGLLIALALTLVYSDAVRRSGLPLSALVLAALAAGASSLHWLPRPHVFTFLLFVIWLERLERVQSGEKIPLWLFPALMLLWVNTHGGFIFGFLAWLAYLAGWIWESILYRRFLTGLLGLPHAETGKKFTFIGLSAFIASIVTPSGWGNWQAVLNNNSRFILSRTFETMPPDLLQPNAWPFLLLLILTVILTVLDKQRAAGHIFLLLGFGLLGLLMARNIPLFALTATPVMAASARRMLNQAKVRVRIEARLVEIEAGLRGFVWPLAATLTVLSMFTYQHWRSASSIYQFNPSVFPAAAADWLAAHPQSGNMFNEFNWGGYLLFRLWPDQKVFLDSQTDFYGEEIMRLYEQTVTGKDWRTAFERYAVEWAIIQPDSGLARTLHIEKGWHILYEDQVAIVLRRAR
ncbi:MAG: hypothetical protein ACOYZ8_11060 [Chloroflexota bacterium]